MTSYYFLASLLPELQIGTEPELSLIELARLFDTNLQPKDREKVFSIRLLYDLEAIRKIWKEEEQTQSFGNFTPADLEEVLLTGEGLPAYVYEFLNRYDEDQDRIRHYPALLSTYFREEGKDAEGFLEQYFSFERQWRLVATAFRAKALGKDLVRQLQYEDPEDPLVAELLAQKDTPQFEAPDGFDQLVFLLEANYESPMEMHKQICQWRFRYLQQLVENNFFGIDRILSYLARVIIAEEWLLLDEQQGLAIIDAIARDET